MILGSKKQFIPKYLDGSKKHSIREGKRWRSGMNIQYYGLCRQPGMYKFMDDRICTGVQDIFMTYHRGLFEVTVDDNYLYNPDILKLAINDGFKDIDEMLSFFIPVIQKKGYFSGQIIHWTDLRY